MVLFSERYKYISPVQVLIREDFPKEIANGVCSCFDELERNMQTNDNSFYDSDYKKMEEYLWVFFLNNRKNDFYSCRNKIVATEFLLDDENPWYRKLDLIEFSIKYLYKYFQNRRIDIQLVDSFVVTINSFFKRLHYSYRIVNKEIVEITSKEEIVSIEKALQESKDNIKNHLATALSLYAKKPTGEYRNSIKESISAVEAYCREKTGEKTLGKALNKMAKNGCIMPEALKIAFEKLYAYTNQPENGIRHALMDEDGEYVPGQEEALFMLVSCSSFLNYLQSKNI